MVWHHSACPEGSQQACNHPSFKISSCGVVWCGVSVVGKCKEKKQNLNWNSFILHLWPYIQLNFKVLVISGLTEDKWTWTWFCWNAFRIHWKHLHSIFIFVITSCTTLHLNISMCILTGCVLNHFTHSISSTIATFLPLVFTCLNKCVKWMHFHSKHLPPRTEKSSIHWTS